MADVLPELPYVAAKWQRAGRRGKRPRLIVLHSTESPEAAKGAENVARYFSTAERVGSSHVVADSDSIVRCVHDADTAMGAAGANDDGLHIEQCGYAAQTDREWLDAYDEAMFLVLRPLIRGWAQTYAIPLVWLTPAQVADGTTRGLCTHADVSRAFPKVSTGHSDPGPNYPKAHVLRIWKGDTPTPPEDDMYDEAAEKRLDAKLAALAALVSRQATDGGFSYAGTDLNAIVVNDEGVMIQVVFFGAGEERTIAGPGLVPTHGASCPIVRDVGGETGRLDVFGFYPDGGFTIATFHPNTGKWGHADFARP